jgi:hypothetical protein
MERGIMEAGHLKFVSIFNLRQDKVSSKPLLLPPHGWPHFRNIIIDYYPEHRIPKDKPQYPFTHLRFGSILLLWICLPLC